jgi:hypothetical protein
MAATTDTRAFSWRTRWSGRISSEPCTASSATAGHQGSTAWLGSSFNRYLAGWVSYFALAETPSTFEDLDKWLLPTIAACRW